MARLTRISHSSLSHRASQVRTYSRTVRWMKVVLPVGAIGLVGLIFLFGQTRDTVFDLQGAGAAAALATGMELENPRFAGVTEAGEPFVITATSALPDGASADRVDLRSPSGEIRLGDRQVLRVTAARGAILRETKRLSLMGQVVLETSDGLRAVTDEVQVDLTAKTALAPGQIRAESPRGSIEADRLDVSNPSGDRNAVVLRFVGNVRVTYRPAP